MGWGVAESGKHGRISDDPQKDDWSESEGADLWIGPAKC